MVRNRGNSRQRKRALGLCIKGPCTNRVPRKGDDHCPEHAALEHNDDPRKDPGRVAYSVWREWNDDWNRGGPEAAS